MSTDITTAQQSTTQPDLETHDVEHKGPDDVEMLQFPGRPTGSDLSSTAAASSETPLNAAVPLSSNTSYDTGRNEQEVSFSIKDGERPPVKLSWNNISYSVEIGKRKNKSKKNILTGVSGFAKPGEVLAIMGSSGAGKTTLLNILSNRIPPNEHVQGTVALNGVDVSSNPYLLRAYGGYVMQDDVFYETMTPRELLRFSATLKLPRTMTPVQIDEKVQKVIDDLGLKNCADTKVGGGFVRGRGLSGGEKKRTAIGVEIITNPSILFLDEPTSGLDSLTALLLMKTLKKLAKEDKRTIICTIHQPSSDMYKLFDSLILMVNGKIIYHGQSSTAVEYFNTQGYRCPSYSNPADYFMAEVMKYKKDDREDNGRFEKLVGAYESHQQHISQVAQKDQISEAGNLKTLDEKILKATRITTLQELSWLMWRSFNNAIKQPMMMQARIGQTVILSLVISAVYSGLSNNQASVNDRQGALFMMAMNNFMAAMGSCVLTFGPEKAIVIREMQSRLYRPGTYFVGKVTSELPFYITFPTLYAIICYFIVGLQAVPVKFFAFLCAITLLGIVGIGLGLIVGSVAPNSSTTASILPVVILPFLLFSGFFVSTNNIPLYFRWIQYISPLYYGLSSLLISEYSGLQLTCLESEKINGQCPYANGDIVLTNLLSLNAGDWGRNVGILVGMFVFTLCVSFAILNKKSN